MAISYTGFGRYTNIGLQMPTATPSSAAQCACPPACPSCGGLDCLCRPRFFPGQVLTDDDLNRLENYVVAKNKLHNRHFHGAGVVCGLEVVCDPCNKGYVTVKTGYALSPCGDDIVVCKDASVNVCDLINQCKPQNPCDPYGYQTPRECSQGIQQWVLSICYDEKASRGVQPLMSEPCSCKSGGGSSCNGSCGCGGSGGGTSSCGCGGTSSTKTAKATGNSASKYNPQCEPTLICETFNFTATRYVDPAKKQSSDLAKYGTWGLIAAKAEQFGPLLTRLILCYLKAIEIRDAFAKDYSNANDTVASTSYVEYLDALREFATEHVAHRCDLARQLANIDVPAQPQMTNRGGMVERLSINWVARFDQLNTLWLEIFRECFCSALLPPCPDAEPNNCVPLAVVTINANDCSIVEICNWTAREFALTLPTLYYWTSFLNWGALKNTIAKLCCDPAYGRIWASVFKLFDKVLANNAQMANAGLIQPLDSSAYTNPASGADTQPAEPMAKFSTTSTATLNALLGMMEQVTMPDGTARFLSMTQPPLQRASQEVADLKDTVAQLKKTVSDQGALIDRLMKQ